MRSTNEIHILPNNEISPRRISRRELAQILLTSAAAGFVSPLSSAIHPINKHLLNAALLDSADARLSTKNGNTLFLSAQQFAALDVLSEAIVPGSHNAQSAAFIDLLLSADIHEAQQMFINSLSAFESASQNNLHSAITALSTFQVHDLLTYLSASDSAGLEHFNHLKDWIVGAYYSSEAGMRELGWTPDRVFPAFPTCPHPEGHA
jgi:Gluconate 2-dehydrogenase subunit 3